MRHAFPCQYLAARNQRSVSHSVRCLPETVRRVLAAATALVAGAAILFAAGTASAQTYKERGLSAIIDNLQFLGPEDGTRFTVPTTSVPAGPDWFGDNTLGWLSAPPYNLNWTNGIDTALQYLAFRSADATQRNVYLSAGDGNGGFSNEYSPEIVIEHLSLENVNVDPNTVRIGFEAPAPSTFTWTMSNSRYDTALATPRFQSTSTLNLSTVASSGTSVIGSWNGAISSPTNLKVNAGSQLTFERVGDIGELDNPDDSKQLFFDRGDQNTADVNGTTMSFQYSGFIFDTASTPAITAGEVTAGFVVRNGGTLELNGSDSSTSATMVEIRGGMRVDGSTVSLGARTTLNVTDTAYLTFENATINLAQDASLHAVGTQFFGTNTLNTTLTAGANGRVRAPMALESGATLNVQGTGDVFAVDILEMFSGSTLNINFSETASKFISSGVMEGRTATVTIAPGNILEIRGVFDQKGLGVPASVTLVNNGLVRVADGGRMIATGTIAEAGGKIVVESGGQLDTRTHYLTDVNAGTIDLHFDTLLGMTLDPTAGQMTALNVDELVLRSIDGVVVAPDLSIQVLNDIQLPLGQKILLADYTTLTNGFSGGVTQFRNLADGDIFQLGLNNYQILYRDPAYAGTAITLTTAVPEPATLVGLVVASPLAFLVARRRRRAGGDANKKSDNA